MAPFVLTFTRSDSLERVAENDASVGHDERVRGEKKSTADGSNSGKAQRQRERPRTLPIRLHRNLLSIRAHGGARANKQIDRIREDAIRGSKPIHASLPPAGAAAAVPVPDNGSGIPTAVHVYLTVLAGRARSYNMEGPYPSVLPWAGVYGQGSGCVRSGAPPLCLLGRLSAELFCAVIRAKIAKTGQKARAGRDSYRK